MCYLRLTWESKFIWHTDFTFWAVAAIHEKLLETYLWFLAASLGVHHPPWRRNGQPPRDLCLYLTTPEEKPSKAPLSHETGQVDNVPAQERLPQTSWQSQWHCWTSPLHVWSLVALHGSRWSAPPTHSSIFEIECRAQRHFGNILAYGHTALPEPQYTKAFQGGLSMAQLHKQLNEHFEATDVIFFTVTSKTHFAWHSLQFSNCIHPFLIWCYEGESTMRRAQILWKSCLHGSKHW